MNDYLTYQQGDTILIQSLKDLSQTAIKPVALPLKRALIPVKNLQIDSSQRIERESLPVQQTVQRRIRPLRAEQNVKIDSAIIKKSQTDVGLALKPLVKQDEVILPVRQINHLNYDWVTLILFFGLVIFASVKNPFARYIGHLFKATFNYPTSARMFRERSYSIVDGAFRLDIYFYLIFSLFVYQVLTYLDVDLKAEGLRLYFFSILGVLFYFSLKRILYLFIGQVSNGQAETIEYLFNMNNYNRVLGLFLFPVVIIMAFSPFFNPAFLVVSGLIFVAVFYGMSLQRGVLILLKKHFSIIYLFLYLCSLEFLPLLLIYKMVLL